MTRTRIFPAPFSRHQYSCTSDKMSAYCREVRKLEGKFDGLELTHVLRNDNAKPTS